MEFIATFKTFFFFINERDILYSTITLFIHFLTELFTWCYHSNVFSFLQYLSSVDKHVEGSLTSGKNPVSCNSTCRPTWLLFSVALPILFRAILPVALHACSCFPLWGTFLPDDCCQSHTDFQKVGANSSLAVKKCAQPLFLHPAHLIILVLWGMLEYILSTSAKPAASLCPLIGRHYKSIWENKAQVKTPFLWFALQAEMLDSVCLK